MKVLGMREETSVCRYAAMWVNTFMDEISLHVNPTVRGL